VYSPEEATALCAKVCAQCVEICDECAVRADRSLWVATRSLLLLRYLKTSSGAMSEDDYRRMVFRTMTARRSSCFPFSFQPSFSPSFWFLVLSLFAQTHAHASCLASDTREARLARCGGTPRP
jgi:hypothetical protein